MRFNLSRIANGANMVRHAVKNTVRSVMPRQQAAQPTPNAPAPKATKPAKATPAAVPSPKKLKPGIKKRQAGFKARMKRQTTANPPLGQNGKPLNKQQRAGAANAAMANWKKRKGIT